MIFPNFRSQLEPELARAHLRVENLFDPLCGLLEVCAKKKTRNLRKNILTLYTSFASLQPMYVLRAPMAATTTAVKGAGLGSVEDAIWKSLGEQREQKETTVYNSHYQVGIILCCNKDWAELQSNTICLFCFVLFCFAGYLSSAARLYAQLYSLQQ